MGYCWYIADRCAKILNEKFKIGDIVQVVAGKSKFKVGIVNDYKNEQGYWPVVLGGELLYFKQRYLALQGRKQLI